MKYQEVSVDYWAMLKAMVMYGFLTMMGWVMMRLFNMVFMLPRRLRNQNQSIQKTLEDLQKRFPDLQVTEEDLKEAEKELEEYQREHEEKMKSKHAIQEPETSDDKKSTESPPEEDKKTI